MNVQKLDGAKVLLVDDDSTCTALLSRYLVSKAYQVAIAEDGCQALEQLDEALPDLIISDIIMPKLDGFTLLEQVRQNANTNWIPIILLSAKTASCDRLKGLNAGANAYLIKPLNLKELLAHVQTLLHLSYSLRADTRRQLEQRIQTPTDVKLTTSELSMAKLVSQGLSNYEISQRLVISKRTVESCISRMLRKTELNNRTELSRWVLENGLA
jgi:DNA-binding NarL/FixJ family response regulator